MPMTALSHARRPHYVLTFAVLTLAALAFALLQSMVAPALPEMQHALHTSPTGVSWILTAYLLTASVATPIAGRLGDMFGKERVLVDRAPRARRRHRHLGALDVDRPDARRPRHPGHRRRRLPARHRHRARRVPQGARRHRHRADLRDVRRGRRHRHRRCRPDRAAPRLPLPLLDPARRRACSRSSRPGCSCPSPPCAARAASTGWARRCCRAGSSPPARLQRGADVGLDVAQGGGAVRASGSCCSPPGCARSRARASRSST